MTYLVLKSTLRQTLLFASISVLLIACDASTTGPKSEQEQSPRLTSELLHECNEHLEAAIVNDFFSPPVAGRIYAYPNIAAYEVLVQKTDVYKSLAGSYDDLSIPPLTSQNVDIALASAFAFYHTSMHLVYATDVVEKGMEELRATQVSNGMDQAILEASEAYGKTVADEVISWANKDGYNEMRSYDKYQLKNEPGTWLPTPPDYTDAMEPHWAKIRPLTLDSASQFRPDAPTAFDMDTSSAFYAELMEVYEALNQNSEETEAIAKFWDCNPLVRKHQGHVTFAEKKLTPGGHWVNIGRIAMRDQEVDLMSASYTYTMLTVGILEAFISCWDEKYHSNYIRPVTVVHEHIDPEWNPILYTPNFPEYPSGHSVVSGSAATILTSIFGDQFNFIDSTEVPYGMDPRSFTSFYEASDEAAISRLYGGIHFMPAIENGKSQGRQVGAHVLKTLNLKN